jgi:chemotaxis protein CheD
MSREYHVKIGELRRGRTGEVLKTTLGSCVGIAILWKARGRYALAHCLLAESPSSLPGPGAKYVSQAVPNLLRSLRAGPGDVADLEVFVAGGGQMMEGTDPARSVGLSNVRSAEAHLNAAGLQNIVWDTGGDLATQIVVDCTLGSVKVRKVPRLDEGNSDVA